MNLLEDEDIADVVKRPDTLKMLHILRDTIQNKLAPVSTIQCTLEHNIDHLDDIIAHIDQLTMDDLFHAVAKLEAATTVQLGQFHQLSDYEHGSAIATKLNVSCKNSQPKLNGMLKNSNKSEIFERLDVPAFALKNPLMAFVRILYVYYPWIVLHLKIFPLEAKTWHIHWHHSSSQRRSLDWFQGCTGFR